MLFFNSGIFITYLIGSIGGVISYLLNLPIPWILGPLLFILLSKIFCSFQGEYSIRLRNIGFVIIGFQIGGTFTATTIDHVIPYLLPFSILTIGIILISIGNGFLLSRWLPIDMKTSMLGAVPGGLSVIIALSESLKANAAIVTIFHTIRLLAVLLIVPLLATQLLVGNDLSSQEAFQSTEVEQGPIWTLIIIIAISILAWTLQNKVPAGLVVIPMILMAMFQINHFPLYHFSEYLYIFAQLAIGVQLGCSISIDDISKAGKYCVYYLIVSITLIAISFGFGYLFSKITSLDLATAILSLVPGGLVEMALTAESVGADPSIVGSLQTLRLLTIVLLLPFALKYLLQKIEKRESMNHENKV
ncbi:AbrB family transcriptional regulator [Aquibacillus koreensis]|uniref:AbrB family transcriptional regulator n=1 Tax=Aquibacillus koreensis TaxID=279446 RepID=A0A9X4ALU6_9BACI|nr:AbrB family transcriptional regulator [Aquibacillus koreensis]MCT2536079.1 AbrB family transcriptional regulator [Aquibacillus koreensis]MDC3422815.1 AbrB family transcriptional regulator [Aquibacillus koreensis]